jgi:hypothetical protein
VCEKDGGRGVYSMRLVVYECMRRMGGRGVYSMRLVVYECMRRMGWW